MRFSVFLRDFILSKLIRKFHQVALVIFVGTVLGGFPSVPGIVGFLLFFLVYLGTYVYNDLVDLEDDRKKGCYAEKVLAMGQATEREFLALLGNLLPVSVLAATLWDPLLGFLSVLAVIVNNIRTHVTGVVKRQFLLTVVELLNFEAFWQAFYGSLIPGIFIPLFLAYSAIYSAGHGVYKLREKKTFDRIMKTREMGFLVFFTLLAVLFALPSLLLSVYHFAVLALATLIYFVPQKRIVSSLPLNRSESYGKVMRSHLLLLSAIGALFILGAVVYIYTGFPLRDLVPFERHLAPFYETAQYFDKLQATMINYVFGDLNGLEDKINSGDL